MTTVPMQTAGGTYGWIGEGAPTPATKSDFSTLSLSRAKAANLVVFTSELARLSSPPAAIGVMRRELIQGCRQFLDGQFIRSGRGGGRQRLAGIHYERRGDVQPVSGLQSSANAQQTDWQSLVTNFLASNPSVENMVVLMTPANAVALSRALNQPSLTIRGGTAHGVPVITFWHRWRAIDCARREPDSDRR